MKRSTKAALISGLIFPGLGHVFLQRYVVGLVLLVLAGGSIFLVASSAIGTALDMANEIAGGGVALDLEAITKLVAQRTQTAERSANVPMIVFLVSWMVGIFDSHRVGRSQEAENDE